MDTPALGPYGFRHDPMTWVGKEASWQGALIRACVFGEPARGDARILEEKTEAVLGLQREDGSFGDTSRDTGAKLLRLLELGVSPERAELRRAADAILAQTRAGRIAGEWYEKDGVLSIYALHALCLMDRGRDKEVPQTLRWLVRHAETWNAPDRGCPWTPEVFWAALWAGRHLSDVDRTIQAGLRRVLEATNDAGCCCANDPWGFIAAAGTVDLPEARELLVRQVPMILRGQQPGGGWGQRSFIVLRALQLHGLLDPLRGLPPLPPDWQELHTVPAPGHECRCLTWDGESLWTWCGARQQAIAIDPETGSVRARLAAAGKVTGIAVWGDALAILTAEPKQVRKVARDSGETLGTIELPGVASPDGIVQVGDKLWIADGWTPCVWAVDPAIGGPPRAHHLAGPFTGDMACHGSAVWHIDLFAPALIRSSLPGELLDWAEKPFLGRCDGLTTAADDGIWALDARSRRIVHLVRTIRKAPPAPPVRLPTRVVVDNVPAPEGRNSVLACCAAVLRHDHPQLTYAELMGAGTQAFRLQFNWCPSAAHATCGFNTAIPALAAAGYQREAFPLAPPDAPPPDHDRREAAREAVRQSIDRGRAAMIDSEESSLIIGYEQDGDHFCFLEPDPEGAGPHRRVDHLPWTISVLHRRKGKPAPRRQLILWALETALRHAAAKRLGSYTAGFAAYDRWIGELRTPQPVREALAAALAAAGRPAAETDVLHALALGSAWCFESLIDARRAAAAYLRSVDASLEEPWTAPLPEAAACYDRLVDLLEEAAPNAPYPADLEEPQAWTDTMRHAVAAALERARDLERNAMAAIEQAVKRAR